MFAAARLLFAPPRAQPARRSKSRCIRRSRAVASDQALARSLRKWQLKSRRFASAETIALISHDQSRDFADGRSVAHLDASAEKLVRKTVAEAKRT